ncbi:hypothetical protein MRX96_045255 [Rhipicephalus microplus]
MTYSIVSFTDPSKPVRTLVVQDVYIKKNKERTDSSPKKETPEAGTEDIGADKSEDAEEDADECPITEQFFRSDVDDLLDTPNENQPLEFASFSDDFDIVETTRGGLCDSRGHRRHHTRNQRHSFPHRHRGKTAIGQPVLPNHLVALLQINAQAHKPAHYQGPVSDYFSPDTTQTPPSLASLMSPATGGLVPQVSHTNGHRTGPVAQSTRRRSSATASHHRRDSNGRRRSLRRQSRDGDESLSTTDSGDSDDFYANSRHRRRSRSSHSRHRRRRSKDRGSRRRHSIDRRGSTHQERDPSVGSFIAHPYAGYLQAPAYQLVAAYPGAPVYPQAPAYPQGPQQAPAAPRPAAYQGPQAFAPAPVQSLVYERPPEYLKSRGYVDASAPLPPSGYAPIPEFQPYGSGRVSFAPGAAPSWNTNTQRRTPTPVTAPPRPRDWRQWQSGLFEPSPPRYSPPPPSFPPPPPPVFSATSYGSWLGAGSEDNTCRCRECCGECCKQAAAVRREQRRIESMMFRSPVPPLWPQPSQFSRDAPFGGGGLLPARSTPWLWPTADAAGAAAEPYWPSVAPTRRFIWSTRRLPRHVWSSGGSFFVQESLLVSQGVDKRSLPPPGYQYAEDTLHPASSGYLATSDTLSPVASPHFPRGESVETMDTSVPGDGEPLSPESPTSYRLSQQDLQPQMSTSVTGIANAESAVSFAVDPSAPPGQDTEHRSILCEIVTSMSSCCGEPEEPPANPGDTQRAMSISPEDSDEAHEQSQRAGIPAKKSLAAEVSVSSCASRAGSTSITSSVSSASSHSALLGSSSTSPRSHRTFPGGHLRPVSMDEAQAVVASDGSAMYGWYQPLHIVSQASESGSQQPLVPVVLAPAEQELLSGAGGVAVEGFFDFTWDAPEEGWRRSFGMSRPDRASSAGSGGDVGRFSWSSDAMRRAGERSSGRGLGLQPGPKLYETYRGRGSSQDRAASETVYESEAELEEEEAA